MGSITETDKCYIASTYARFPVEIASGKGSLVFDTDGKRYIDLGSGIAVSSFGIADDEWQAAVIDQISKVQHTSNLYYSEPCAKLAEMLCERTGMSKVFFSNSGAEANECAIKAARKYAFENKGPEYCTIITLENSFHGRTLTTLAATGQERFHELFQPLTPGFVSVPANDIVAMREAVASNKVAGILIECVQGEGGVNVLDPIYVTELAQLAETEDILLMVDEVQTGNGRTGSLYAYEQFDIAPDVVTTAKGLAGGLPLGATLLGDKVKDVFSPGDHGSTFGGNPVCAAAAISVLGRIDESLLTEVRGKAELIRDSLERKPGIKSVSGMGLMVGIETSAPAGDIVRECIERGILCLTAKGKVRLLPALTIPQELLEEALGILAEVCAEKAETLGDQPGNQVL